MAAIDDLPGYRRAIVITPAADQVSAALEDDYHCMLVTLHHDGVAVTQVDAVMQRAPWTTCPGARQVLADTFTGVALTDVARRGLKQANCTHLHDLAVLAAAHAHDHALLRYDMLVSDAADGEVTGEIRANGLPLLRISYRDDVLTAPTEIAGTSLFKLRGWIESLDEQQREAARLLQWGAIVAHGRAIPMERQSDASRMPPNCFTFQPDRRDHAVRVGRIIDFTAVGERAPLSR